MKQNIGSLMKDSWRRFKLQLGIDIADAIVTPRKFLIFFLEIVFCILFLGAAISLLCLSCKGFKHLLALEEEYTIKGIEYIFISPLPLLIISAFYSYYKKIISPTITHEQKDIDYAEQYRNKALLDLSIIKYLFISILISTTLIIILQSLFKQESLEQLTSYQKLMHVLESRGPDLITAVILLIFLLIYFRLLGQQLSKEMNHGSSDKSLLNYEEDIDKAIESTEKKIEKLK